MLYDWEWYKLRSLSQCVARDIEIKDLHTIKDLVEDTSSLNISSIFSESTFSTRPSTKDSTFNVEKEFIIQNKELSENQKEYIFETMKQGFDLFKTIDLENNEMEITNDKVALKLHNPRIISYEYEYASEENGIVDFHMSEEHDEESLRYASCLNNYLTELEYYKKLGRNKEFNSIGYDHKDIFVILLINGFNNSIGFTNIFKYIETEELPNDFDTYKEATKKLEIIHQAGFIHRDIVERNILYSKGKVYIIDFSRAAYYPNEESLKEEDSYGLKKIF